MSFKSELVNNNYLNFCSCYRKLWVANVFVETFNLFS